LNSSWQLIEHREHYHETSSIYAPKNTSRVNQRRRLFAGIESLESRRLLTATGFDSPAEQSVVGDEAAAWTNAATPCDVNDDGRMSAVDALIVVNYINTDNGGELTERTADSKAHYVDVNGDNYVNPADVLAVVNRLNQDASVEFDSTPTKGEPQGEDFENDFDDDFGEEEFEDGDFEDSDFGDGDFGDGDSDFEDGDADFEFTPETAAQEELDEYDTDGDQLLSVAELTAEFVDYGDSQEDAIEFAQMLIEDFDTDGDQQLSLSELVTSYSQDDFGDDDFEDGDFEDGDADFEFTPETAAQEELDEYDTDGDQLLSVAELTAEFVDYGDSEEDAIEFAQMLIQDFDIDGDQQLSLSELIASYGDGECECEAEDFDDFDMDSLAVNDKATDWLFEAFGSF
jgi:hypothetical protein